MKKKVKLNRNGGLVRYRTCDQSVMRVCVLVIYTHNRSPRLPLMIHYFNYNAYLMVMHCWIGRTRLLLLNFYILTAPVPQQVLHIFCGPPSLSGTLPVPRHIAHLITLLAIDNSFRLLLLNSCLCRTEHNDNIWEGSKIQLITYYGPL